METSTILVLGGTSGIGLAVAGAVLKLGATVVVASSNESKIQSALRWFESYRLYENKVFGRACDLSDPVTLDSNISSLLEYANSLGGNGLTHVVHTAGELFAPTALVDFDPSSAFSFWTVRYLTGMVIGKHARAYPSLQSITVTSGSTPPAGKTSVMGMIGAIESMTKALAVELAPIRVNCVSPGLIDTELTARVRSSEAGMTVIDKLVHEQQVLQKWGKPHDVAAAYVYFLTDTFQTGSVLATDGGLGLKDKSK